MEICVSLLARCPEHGLVPSMFNVHFDLSEAIELSSGGHLEASNVLSTCPIPNCGELAAIEDGFYDFAELARKLILELNPNRDQAAEIARISQSVSRSELSMEEAADQAEAVVAGGSKLFNISEWGDQAKATLYTGIIGAFALAISQCSFEGPLIQVNPATPVATTTEKDIRVVPPTANNKRQLNVEVNDLKESPKPKKRPPVKSKRPMWRK